MPRRRGMYLIRSIPVGWLVLLAAGCVKPTDRPFLWLIDGRRPSYLYGTIHVPDARVVALPPAVQNAFAVSHMLYVEAPLDSAAQKQVEDQSRLPAGEHLKDVLPPDLYQRTAKYFRSKGVSLAALSDRQIWVVAATIELLDFLWDAVWRSPLDKKLYDMARHRGKAIGALETVAEQMAVFGDLTPEDQIRQLESTLAQYEEAARKQTNPSRELVGIYLRGDEAEMSKTVAAAETAAPAMLFIYLP